MKNLILEKLKQKKDYTSGEELSGLFNVSRTAIWKHINELRKEGYHIISSTRKGYQLVDTPDILDSREVRIPAGQLIGKEIIHFEEIDSTNNYAKKIANEGCRDGTVVVSERQTMARGRVGRQWESFTNEGLWFSIVLRPDLEPEYIKIVTLAAAVAVVEGISEVQGIVCGIKWPNDIILNGRKLGGILTELSAEPEHINYVVVGIGININQDKNSFNAEIKNKATSLRIHTGETVSRVRLLEGILTGFDRIYSIMLQRRTQEIIDSWSGYSVTLGKEVKIVLKNTEYIGLAQSIASDGRLIVKCNDGVIREIAAGEIQVRGLLGYT
ncbi:BirA family biotin operon repressor/biotin-[acetyl-CoA-carboxylase] ligase [Ruminiclostridium sufflavum DSM 19573]|uniref:Bifunctional ligase/repressor BirA n=1 Tax=Ruminiclostridium sufflavum DSM 19573 TaxID=1121337 RepID=A0A318XQ24_9FIRM|nr:biotin--[acetyl-CoA-carboxylase] ligase [Ruminiclostridium sufflavum]PYG89165.1 BirA family biotin operon repressor/biotin-[acetyl-CoA-carboxylase] ligase [Ruminiclostridium sufflavum DSM 19573]